MSEPNRRGLPPRPGSRPPSDAKPQNPARQESATSPLPRAPRPRVSPESAMPKRPLNLPQDTSPAAPRPTGTPKNLPVAPRPQRPQSDPSRMPQAPSRPLPAGPRPQMPAPTSYPQQQQQAFTPPPSPQQPTTGYSSGPGYPRGPQMPQGYPSGPYGQTPMGAIPQSTTTKKPLTKNPKFLGLVGGGVGLSALAIVGGIYVIPGIFGGSDDGGLGGGGKGASISAEEKITAEDIKEDMYFGVMADNAEGIDPTMSVHRWSYDWGMNEYDEEAFTQLGYSNKDHSAYAFFNVFPAESINDEATFKEQVTKLAGEIDAQYGLGGVKGFSELETNHTGDFRIGAYHNGGGENGGIEAMTIFNISGNRIVASTVLLTNEIGRLDYQQMAVSALEVKAISG